MSILRNRSRRPADEQGKRPSRVSPGSIARLEKSSVLLLIYLYCLVHYVIRVLIAPVYTIEESEQLLLSQSLQFGYTASAPPLLTWIYAGLSMWPGLSAPVVFAVKYLLLCVGLSFFYLSARNILTSSTASAGAVAGLGLTYIVGWGMHEDMLNAVGLMACMSLTLHALTRILTWRRWRDWVYLGFAMGAGLLTSHLFMIFPVALLAAAMMSSFLRDAVKLRLLALALAIAFALKGVYAFWFFTHVDRIPEAFADFAESWSLDPVWFNRALTGAVDMAGTLVSATLPLSLFWATLFWSIWLPILYPVFERRSTNEEPHEEAWRGVLARAPLFAALLILAGVVVGVQEFKTYWMLPAIFTIPIWMAAHVKRAGEFPVMSRAFATIFIVLSFGIIGGRFVEWQYEIAMCSEAGCRPYTPVPEWEDELRHAGFSVGTIVGADPHLTGNLRAAFPEARVLDTRFAPAAYPAASTNGACLVVWRNVTVMPESLADYLVIQLGARPRDRGPEGAIRRNLRQSYTKASTLYFQFVPPSEGCR